MTGTFTITSVKDPGWDPDQYGNKKWSVGLSGVQGDALWNTKSQPQVGDTVYGTVENVAGQSGKIYQKFTKQKQEDAPQPAPANSGWTGGGLENKPQPDSRNEDIMAQTAVKCAVSIYAGSGKFPADEVLTTANTIRKMFDDVKAKAIGSVVEEVKEVMDVDDEDEPIDLSDIPF